MDSAATYDDGIGVNSTHQPYYVVSSAALTVTDWYKLCALSTWLNRMGFESYIQAGKTEGHFWAPLLSSKVQIAHYRDGKKPIVLNIGFVGKNPLGIGVQSHIWWGSEVNQAQIEEIAKLDDVYIQGDFIPGQFKRLQLPLPELTFFAKPQPLDGRQKSLLYVCRYTGAVAPEWQTLERVTPDYANKMEILVGQLQSAKWLYMYEWCELAVLARWAGCAVVLIPNPQCLPEKQVWIDACGGDGLAWGHEIEQTELAASTVGNFRHRYLEKLSNWRLGLRQLIDDTQQRVNNAEFGDVWPQQGLDGFPELFTEPDQQSARADRLKWARVHEQYNKWKQRSSLREIDAQIYAEHLMSGQLQSISVVIDHRGTSVNQLADSLDSLSVAFGESEWIGIVSDQPAPHEFEPNSKLVWLDHLQWQSDAKSATSITTPWTLLVKAGTLLAPHAIIEWMLAANSMPLAKIIYADEDVQRADGECHYPNFKPDINVELLRCTNYLGNAMLVKSTDWHAVGRPLFDGRIYGVALDLLAGCGKSAFGHIDTVLFHSGAEFSSESESAEFEAAKSALKASHPEANLMSSPRLGTWLPCYATPCDSKVSLVVSTGLQTGYLGSLLGSVLRYQSTDVDDVVLVCQESQRDEVELVVAAVGLNNVRIVNLMQANYNHAQALNSGVAQARHEVVLIADDDTELLELDGLAPMLGILNQSDVACVAPRLVASVGADPKIVAGPVILGIDGSAVPYVGETQGLTEVGVYSRLQLSQDVSAVAGHFFLIKVPDWREVGGFDETKFPVFNTVLDFCLKLNELGKRHVWTPLTNVLHQGGKTMEVHRRDIQHKILLAEQEILERRALQGQWAKELASDPYYNRHLSLTVPFDIEADIVVDWQPKRHDRPRVLALPIYSGAGQYRVVEPLNALQDAGLAQTSVVLPVHGKGTKLMQALELVRAAPDCLILQHSVDDGQLSLIDEFKNAAPDIKIIQTVDDLLSEVSEKHPNHKYLVREGHRRIMKALSRSDRLIVTTKPLAEHYKKYVSDVHIVPNTLGQVWMGLRNFPKPRSRLRVGWVGAGQHQGDLELVNTVVHELAAEVDWVFMGMCTDEIKPLLTEFHEFVSIGDYPKKMSELDLDIAIAPIEDNFFNQCKSNLRLLEYGAMGWPVVCSDVYPYRTDNPPVLRVKNNPLEWVEAIRSLYDTKLRHSKAEALHQWVISRYRLEVNADTWYRSIFG